MAKAIREILLFAFGIGGMVLGFWATREATDWICGEKSTRLAWIIVFFVVYPCVSAFAIAAAMLPASLLGYLIAGDDKD